MTKTNLNFEYDVRIPDALVQQWLDGEITCAMLNTMVILYKWANWSTGYVKWVSSGGLRTASRKQYSDRTFRVSLQRLEEMGWITRHMTPGSHKDYPVTINNYKVVDDAGKVHILNPKYIKVSDPSATAPCREASHEGSQETSQEGSQKDLSDLLPDTEPDHEPETIESVSQSVSELVALPTSESKPEILLSEEANTILNHIYPRFNPIISHEDADKLNEIARVNDTARWDDFFDWHRTHKPDNLRYRSLERFFAGVVYSLNDREDHDANTCKVCNPVKSKAKPERSPALDPNTIFGAPVPENLCSFHRTEILTASRLDGSVSDKAVNDVMKASRKCSNCQPEPGSMEAILAGNRAKAQAAGAFEAEEAE